MSCMLLGSSRQPRAHSKPERHCTDPKSHKLQREVKVWAEAASNPAMLNPRVRLVQPRPLGMGEVKQSAAGRRWSGWRDRGLEEQMSLKERNEETEGWRIEG